MSHVTDIILVTGIEDGAKHQNEHPNADYVSEYLEKEHNCKLNKVDQYAGGGKKVQCDVFMAAINYLNIPLFVEHFYSVKWSYPELVQLMIKDEHDEKFTIYEPKI